jgi:hypothetical protein
MAILKGLERCMYISDIIDMSDYLVWSKDMSGNLLFVNKKAFDVFKKLSSNDIIECPFNITDNSENNEDKIELDNKDMWLRYSSEIVDKSDGKKILVVAKDITEEKKKEQQLEKVLDEKILEWKKEERERSERIDKSNKEVYRILNFIKGEANEQA